MHRPGRAGPGYSLRWRSREVRPFLCCQGAAATRRSPDVKLSYSGPLRTPPPPSLPSSCRPSIPPSPPRRPVIPSFPLPTLIPNPSHWSHSTDVDARRQAAAGLSWRAGVTRRAASAVGVQRQREPGLYVGSVRAGVSRRARRAGGVVFNRLCTRISLTELVVTPPCFIRVVDELEYGPLLPSTT